MKISVDIDGILADQVGAALKMIEKEYGQDLLEAMVIAPIGGSEKR